MSNTSLFGVVGTDGVQPVYQPDARWCIWALFEIYLGQQGSKKYVPKVKDFVIDPDTYTTYIVDHIDPVTFIPTIREIRPANMAFSFTESDILFGVSSSSNPETYRVYVDKSVTPAVIAVDARVLIPGSLTSYAKLFKGYDISATGTIAAFTINSIGEIQSTNIPLELVSIDSHENHSIKTIKPAYTNLDLKDGDLVTLVVYSDDGHVVYKRQLLAENTAFIRSVNISQKYITHISLESSYLSQLDNSLLEVPVNTTINSVNLIGVVHYSDGSVLKLPVDGTKFRMYGIEQQLSSIVGQAVDLVLAYSLAPNETAYAGVSSDGKYITSPYTMVTTSANYSYTVKLFGYPVWIDSVNGYQMKWWLYNLDRNIVLDVTGNVVFNSNTGPFNPKLYGYSQRKSVSINLRDVSAAFKPFIHTQQVEIILYGEPQNGPTPYEIATEGVAGIPYFGTGLTARRVNSTSVDISFSLTNQSNWLALLYKNTYPLIDRSRELEPITPTHFIVQYGSQEVEVPISGWSSTINLNRQVTLYSSVQIKFIKKTASGDMQLSIASVIVR